MSARPFRVTALAVALCLPLAALAASPLDSLKGAASGALGGGGGDGGSTALLGQLGGGSFALGSAQNAAGVLSWCQSQGYLPSASDTIKDKLMSRMGLENPAKQDDDYRQGAAGVLHDAQGGSFDLSRFKDVAGKKVCGSVADQAASTLLGG